MVLIEQVIMHDNIPSILDDMQARILTIRDSL